MLPIHNGSIAWVGSAHVVTQRCIGYQRYGQIQRLASVYETQWDDGQTTFNIHWEGNMSFEYDQCPRIDVPTTETTP